MVEDTTVTGLDLTATRENHRTKEPKTTKQVENQALDTTGPRDQRTEQAERESTREPRKTNEQGPQEPRDRRTRGPADQRTT